jgi:hypothetical protein
MVLREKHFDWDYRRRRRPFSSSERVIGRGSEKMGASKKAKNCASGDGMLLQLISNMLRVVTAQTIRLNLLIDHSLLKVSVGILSLVIF